MLECSFISLDFIVKGDLYLLFCETEVQSQSTISIAVSPLNDTGVTDTVSDN